MFANALAILLWTRGYGGEKCIYSIERWVWIFLRVCDEVDDFQFLLRYQISFYSEILFNEFSVLNIFYLLLMLRQLTWRGLNFFKAQLRQLSVNKEKTINSDETLILKEIFVVVLGLPLTNLKYGLTMDLKFENSFKFIGL